MANGGVVPFARASALRLRPIFLRLKFRRNLVCLVLLAIFLSLWRGRFWRTPRKHANLCSGAANVKRVWRRAICAVCSWVLPLSVE